MPKRGRKRIEEMFPIEFKCVPVGDSIYCASSQGEIFGGYYDRVVLKDEQGNELVELFTTWSREKGIGMGGRISVYGIRGLRLKCKETEDEEGREVLECVLETEGEESKWRKKRTIIVGSPPY